MWPLLVLALAAAACADCPRHCECKWRSGKESALCARAALTAIPPRLPPTTQLLDLSDNRLNNLREDAFANAGLLNLQRLYLISCSIKTIRVHAFRALVNLVELDLSRNRLEFVPSNAFADIPELRELRLDGNPITKIKDEAFHSLPNLVRLSLKSCKISEIEPRAFVGVEGNLEYLEIDKNRLQVLHVASLAPLRSLKGLELANNPWECTCALRPLRDWMIKRNVPATVVPECALPPRLMSLSWDRLDLEDFACSPEVRADSKHTTGTEGDDVKLICRVNGVAAARVRWFRSGRLLANSTNSNNLNSERSFLLHSEGATSNLTIKLADIQDAGSYTCAAENRAGKAEALMTLSVQKRPPDKGIGSRALIAGFAVLAVIVLSLGLATLCVRETRKRRRSDRWNEQIVTSNHRDENYAKIESDFGKGSVEDGGRVMVECDGGRKRGDYRNVPMHDPEEDCGGYVVRGAGDGLGWRREVLPEPQAPAWTVRQEPDLHIPRLPDFKIRNTRHSCATRQTSWRYLRAQRQRRHRAIHPAGRVGPGTTTTNTRADATPDSVASSTSTGVIGGHARRNLDDNGLNNNPPRFNSRPRDRLDNDLSGSDSEKNYPDLIEMSALGVSSYLRNEKKHDPYFYTMPRRKDADSRSPLLGSRRNSSGGDSAASLEKSYERPKPAGRRSNSFLDLSSGNMRSIRNPSLPTTPTKQTAPSATPLLDLPGLNDFSQRDQLLEDYDFRASQLEKFLEEYRNLRVQLSKMKETRENLQRSRAVDSNSEMRSLMKGKPIVAVTETSSLAALPDAASPLTLASDQHTRPDWISALMYRN